MTYKEYREFLKYELYHDERKSLLQKIRIRYFQPNTNCMLMARKMWFLYSRGRINRFIAKLLYLKISRRYGCILYPSAIIGKGFHITHPVGIVLGDCIAGDNFMIYQNCSVGTRRYKDEPVKIGNHVMLCSNSLILGNVSITNDVVIGAASLVMENIETPGLYAGNPIRKLK